MLHLQLFDNQRIHDMRVGVFAHPHDVISLITNGLQKQTNARHLVANKYIN